MCCVHHVGFSTTTCCRRCPGRLWPDVRRLPCNCRDESRCQGTSIHGTLHCHFGAVGTLSWPILVSTAILATHTPTVVTALDTSCVTFAVLFHAGRFATLAPQLMCQFYRRLIWNCLFEFDLKGLWIPRENTPNGRKTFLFMSFDIVTYHTSTVNTTINFHGKTLAVQFETFCLFAGASHGGNFFPVNSFNLTWTGGTFTVPCIHIHYFHGSLVFLRLRVNPRLL